MFKSKMSSLTNTGIRICLIFILFIGVISDDGTRTFSCGRRYYRRMVLDALEESLFVGAMDWLFRLKTADINDTVCVRDPLNYNPDAQFHHPDAFYVVPHGVINCSKLRFDNSDDYRCHNHVRVLMNIDGPYYYICGTNAYHASDYIINAERGVEMKDEQKDFFKIWIANGRCPVDPDYNNSAAYVKGELGIESFELFTGSAIDDKKSSAAISRVLIKKTDDLYEAKDLRTKSDFKWMNSSDFVGAYVAAEYVYFLFREYRNDASVSRIARVCIKDQGMVRSNLWASYFKARITCYKTKQEYNESSKSYYTIRKDYDIIQDSYYHDQKFYGIFTSSQKKFSESAFCSYKLESVVKVFKGDFETDFTEKISKPAAKTLVPDPHPSVCVAKVRLTYRKDGRFIINHPLMSSIVSNENGKPIYYTEYQEFTKLIVGQYNKSADGIDYTFIFAGTITGTVYYIVERKLENTLPMLVNVFSGTSPESIRAMVYAEKGQSLFISSDTVVRQIRLGNCAIIYTNCLQCALDPFCGWSEKSNICESYKSGSIHLGKDSFGSGFCGNRYLSSYSIAANSINSFSMKCSDVISHAMSRSFSTKWFKSLKCDKSDNVEINKNISETYEVDDNEYYFPSLKTEDAGCYFCKIQDTTLCTYKLKVVDVTTNSFTVSLGQTFHADCNNPYISEVQASPNNISWFRCNGIKIEPTQNYTFKNYELIIASVSSEDAGCYNCKLRELFLCKFYLAIKGEKSSNSSSDSVDEITPESYNSTVNESSESYNIEEEFERFGIDNTSVPYPKEYLKVIYPNYEVSPKKVFIHLNDVECEPDVNFPSTMENFKIVIMIEHKKIEEPPYGKQSLLWMVVNIVSDNDISSGETIFYYESPAKEEYFYIFLAYDTNKTNFTDAIRSTYDAAHTSVQNIQSLLGVDEPHAGNFFFVEKFTSEGMMFTTSVILKIFIIIYRLLLKGIEIYQ